MLEATQREDRTRDQITTAYCRIASKEYVHPKYYIQCSTYWFQSYVVSVILLVQPTLFTSMPLHASFAVPQQVTTFLLILVYFGLKKALSREVINHKETLPQSSRFYFRTDEDPKLAFYVGTCHSHFAAKLTNRPYFKRQVMYVTLIENVLTRSAEISQFRGGNVGYRLFQLSQG